LYSQSVMGIIPRSKRFRIFFLLGGSLFVWAVFVEVFWMPASRHKIRLGRPVMGGAVDEVISRYSDVTGDDAPDEVRLHVAGENWSRPFKWTLTVISDKKTVYECSGDDAGIDKFFNDKGYVSGGCESYLECKKQYYLKDMPANLFAAWPGENKPGGAWAAGMRSAASEELMTKFKLPAEEAAKEPVKAEEAKSEPAGELAGKLEQGVEMIELSSRASNCLKVAGIRTIGELVRKSEDDLLAVKNFGQKSLDEIKDKLKEMGLSLGMKID